MRKGQVINRKAKKKKKTIIATFSSFKEKQKDLSETWTLKGTNISINEDYSKETLEIGKGKLEICQITQGNSTSAILVYRLL